MSGNGFFVVKRSATDPFAEPLYTRAGSFSENSNGILTNSSGFTLFGWPLDQNGNVIGSQGSVVPLFKEQIAHGGPVTLTDAGMTRYFMAVNEAVELIIQAASLARGGETFLLDMGEPVRIGDLAENMIRLAGLSVRDVDNPTGDIAIEVVGARPGEKVVEELFYDPARVERTAHPKIMFGKKGSNDNGRVKDAVRRSIQDLAPGGGFVFCQVHNIQPDVPPGNVVAMFEALDEGGAG